MEPWILEQQRQRRLDAYWAQMPRCVCCGAHIRSEQCLALDDFGLHGYACQRCTDAALVYTEDVSIG